MISDILAPDGDCSCTHLQEIKRQGESNND